MLDFSMRGLQFMGRIFGNKKMHVLLYTISSLLLLSFLTIAIIAFTCVHVSTEYSMFYITHELKYYLPDGALENEYSINTVFDYTSNGNYKNQGVGWYNATTNGTPMAEKRSDIYFYVGDNCSATIQLSIVLNEAMNFENKLFINNCDAGYTFSFCSGSETASFSSSFLVKKSINKLSLIRDENAVNLFVKEVLLHD